MTAGAQVLHFKQCLLLPLPGILVSNKKTNADKWKDVFAGIESIELENRPTQGSHRKFQTHFLILSLATINSSQIECCIFTLLRLKQASPIVCPILQDASLKLYSLVWLLYSIISILCKSSSASCQVLTGSLYLIVLISSSLNMRHSISRSEVLTSWQAWGPHLRETLWLKLQTNCQDYKICM